jgi:hypothetical protein
VIDHLEHLASESKSGLGFIYCDYKDPEHQSTENIVGAIIKQLLIQLPEIPDSVSSRSRNRMNAGKPLSLGEASELFHIICAQFSRVYICLDALDELQESNLRRILKWIHDGPSVQVFITSRPHIQDVVLEYLESQHTITIRANESDIRRFIEHEIGGPNDIAPRAMDEKLKGDMFAKILGSAKGMLVYMELYLPFDYLADSIGKSDFYCPRFKSALCFKPLQNEAGRNRWNRFPLISVKPLQERLLEYCSSQTQCPNWQGKSFHGSILQNGRLQSTS